MTQQMRAQTIRKAASIRGHKLTSSHDFSHYLGDVSKDTIKNAVTFRIGTLHLIKTKKLQEETALSVIK